MFPPFPEDTYASAEKQSPLVKQVLLSMVFPLSKWGRERAVRSGALPEHVPTISTPSPLVPFPVLESLSLLPYREKSIPSLDHVLDKTGTTLQTEITQLSNAQVRQLYMHTRTQTYAHTFSLLTFAVTWLLV